MAARSLRGDVRLLLRRLSRRSRSKRGEPSHTASVRSGPSSPPRGKGLQCGPGWRRRGAQSRSAGCPSFPPLLGRGRLRPSWSPTSPLLRPVHPLLRPACLTLFSMLLAEGPLLPRPASRPPASTAPMGEGEHRPSPGECRRSLWSSVTGVDVEEDRRLLARCPPPSIASSEIWSSYQHAIAWHRASASMATGRRSGRSTATSALAARIHRRPARRGGRERRWRRAPRRPRPGLLGSDR
jgi:hypothetical protein